MTSSRPPLDPKTKLPYADKSRVAFGSLKDILNGTLDTVFPKVSRNDADEPYEYEEIAASVGRAPAISEIPEVLTEIVVPATIDTPLDPPPHVTSDRNPVMSAQHWAEFSTQISPDLLDIANASNWVTLYSGLTPFSLCIDLGTIDQNDRFQVREEIYLDSNRNSPKAIHHTDHWRLTSMYELRVTTNPRRLYIDDTASEITDLAFLQPQPGPWWARVRIVQKSGVSKAVRYMVY